MGAEFKGKGGRCRMKAITYLYAEFVFAVHVALGPMMNLMRVPAAGRNWEGYVQWSHDHIYHIAHLRSSEVEEILSCQGSSHSKL